MIDSIDRAALFAALEATWPAASVRRLGPWTIREGLGGGSRVSAATAEGDAADADIPRAEAAMRALGQAPLFMLRSGEDALDACLAARDYALRDPVIAWAAPVATLAAEALPPVTAFEVWPPLAVQVELWAEGGIGPARIAVMERVAVPKTALLGRLGDRPAGTAFVAAAGPVAMVHAIEVTAAARRRGLGRWLMRAAAHWAAGQGADHLALVATRRNTAANGLYASLGMAAVTEYHYRALPA
jgi:GNAT superfamily N-acetyltransferase